MAPVGREDDLLDRLQVPGVGVREDRPIEANLITTGELTATGSADTRILNIPLHPQSIDKGKALFARLESRSYRAARALLGIDQRQLAELVRQLD